MKILKCTTPDRGSYELIENEIYEFIQVEHGIFQNTPYVKVKEMDTGKKITCHFYRFYDDKQFLENEYKKLEQKTPFNKD